MINIESIVARFSTTNGLGKVEYPALYTIACAGVRDLNQNVTGEARYADICLEPDKTGRLPEDFINDTKVYVLGDASSGLLEDESLGMKPRSNYVNEKSSSFDPTISARSVRHSPANWVGYYKVLREANRIMVNWDFPHEHIRVEYLGHPYKNSDGEYFIHEYCEEALYQYIEFQWNGSRKSTSMYERLTLKGEYRKARKAAKRKMSNPSMSQLQDAAVKGKGFKIKY